MMISMLISSLLTITGCGSDDKNKTTSSKVEAQSTQPIKSSDVDLPANAPTYNVATISTFTPFIFRNEYGNSVGFDVDILKAIGQKEGFKVNYLVVPWEEIFDKVNTENYDIISSAVVITPEREKLVDFSTPYIESGRMAVVKKDLKDKKIQDLKDLKFAVQAGTSNEPIVEEIVSNKNNIIPVNTQYMTIQQLMSGEADVAFDDSRVMQYYVSQNPDLYGIPYEEYPGDKLGFAVKKGNQKLLQQINDGLQKIIADGTYAKIYKQWFGEEAPAEFQKV